MTEKENLDLDPDSTSGSNHKKVNKTIFNPIPQ